MSFLDCNKPLIPFFERMGYFSYTGWVFHKEFGTVRPMVFAVDAIEYLRRLKSFLADAASLHTADGQYGGYDLIRRHAETPMTDSVSETAAAYLAGEPKEPPPPLRQETAEVGAA